MSQYSFLLGLSVAAAAAAITSATHAGVTPTFVPSPSAAVLHRHQQEWNAGAKSKRIMSTVSGDGDKTGAVQSEVCREDGCLSRRQYFASAISSMGLVAAAAAATARDAPKLPPRARLPDGDTQGSDYMELGGGSKSFAKPRIRYSDFETMKNGLQYKDAKIGSGKVASEGDRVVMDWEGYTIGYNGGVFETTKGPKGGAYDGDKTSTRFVLGQGTVIPGLEQGILGMKQGGVRQIVVPPELGYPENDRKHDVVGPKPSTFSGYRTLDFVLSNPGYIDKTLLFTVRLVRVDKPGERGSRVTGK